MLVRSYLYHSHPEVSNLNDVLPEVPEVVFYSIILYNKFRAFWNLLSVYNTASRIVSVDCGCVKCFPLKNYPIYLIA